LKEGTINVRRKEVMNRIERIVNYVKLRNLPKVLGQKKIALSRKIFPFQDLKIGWAGGDMLIPLEMRNGIDFFPAKALAGDNPPPFQIKSLKPFDTREQEEILNHFQKPKLNWLSKLAAFGTPLLAGGASAFFLPLQVSAIALSPLAFYGLGSWLFPAVMIPNLTVGLLLGIGIYSGMKKREKNLTENKILQSENYYQFAWILAQKEKDKTLNPSLKKLIEKFEKRSAKNNESLKLARLVQEEKLEEAEKRLLYQLLISFPKADEEKKVEAEIFFNNILEKVKSEELKERIRGKLPGEAPPQEFSQLIEIFKELSLWLVIPAAGNLIDKYIKNILNSPLTQELKLSATDPDNMVREFILVPTSENKGQKITKAHLLGKGGMAEVYKALDPEKKQFVAVKLLTDPTLKDTLEREYEAMTKINHPLAVKVYASGGMKIGNEIYPFIVEEYLPWPDLAKYLANKGEKLSPSQAAKIAGIIAQAMHEISTKWEIAHRDLKPANIFITEEEGKEEFKIKISDFGLARDFEAKGETVTRTYLGTPFYVAPYYMKEYGMLTREDRNDPKNKERIKKILTKNDIYALGVILYRLLTGSPLIWKDGENKLYQIGDESSWEKMKEKDPNNWRVKKVTPISPEQYQHDYIEYISHKSVEESKAKQIKEKFSLVQSIEEAGVTIPDPLYEIIKKMTAFDPTEAYDSFLEVKHALESYLSGQPYVEPKRPPSPTISRKEETKPLPVIEIEEFNPENYEVAVEYLLQAQKALLLNKEVSEAELQEIFNKLNQVFHYHPRLEEYNPGILQIIIDRISKKGEG